MAAAVGTVMTALVALSAGGGRRGVAYQSAGSSLLTVCLHKGLTDRRCCDANSQIYEVTDGRLKVLCWADHEMQLA